MIYIITHLTLYLVAGELTKGIVFTTLTRATLVRVSGASGVYRHEQNLFQLPQGQKDSASRDVEGKWV